LGSYIPCVAGTAVVIPQVYTSLAAADGTGSITFWGNYQLNATASFYQVSVFGVDASGNVSNSANLTSAYQFNFAGSFDLSSISPLSGNPGLTNYWPIHVAASDLSNGTTGSGAVVLANAPILVGDTIIQKSVPALLLNDTTGGGHEWKIRSTGGFLEFLDANESGYPRLALGGVSGGVLVGRDDLLVDEGVGTLNVLSGYYSNSTAGITQTAGVPTSIATMGGIVTTLTVTSDERLKDAVPYAGGLDEILAINPIQYRWNERGKEVTGDKLDREYVGFSAQDVQKSIPLAIVGKQVAKDGMEYLGFDDRPVIAALVNAVKEQQKVIRKLERRIKALEGC
jgi:hypothetical protein